MTSPDLSSDQIDPPQQRGLLFSQMEPPAELTGEFHDWYENDHIPARMAIPGFASADRYEVIDGSPRYLACYHLYDLGALQSPEYKRLKADPGPLTERMLGAVKGFTRYTCLQVSDTGETVDEPAALFAVAFEVPDTDVDEFDAWYGDEHVPLLMEVDGWQRVRRYVRTGGFDGPGWTHLALHELSDVSALDDPRRAAARDTDRRDRLTRHEWFNRSWRWLYRPIHHATATHGQAPAGANGGQRSGLES